MRTFALLAAASLLFTLPVQGQERETTKFEIGTHLGGSILIPDGGDTEFVFGVPGAGTMVGLFPPIYLTFFAGNLMVEPQIAFVYESVGDNGLFNGALQLGYLLNAEASGSMYFAAHGLAVNAFGDGSATEWAAGASLGYRTVIKNALSLRFEARYRRYFESDLNDIGIIIGVGAAIH